jgi:hypothetical protein
VPGRDGMLVEPRVKLTQRLAAGGQPVAGLREVVPRGQLVEPPAGLGRDPPGVVRLLAAVACHRRGSAVLRGPLVPRHPRPQQMLRGRQVGQRLFQLTQPPGGDLPVLAARRERRLRLGDPPVDIGEPARSLGCPRGGADVLRGRFFRSAHENAEPPRPVAPDRCRRVSFDGVVGQRDAAQHTGDSARGHGSVVDHRRHQHVGDGPPGDCGTEWEHGVTVGPVEHRTVAAYPRVQQTGCLERRLDRRPALRVDPVGEVGKQP